MNRIASGASILAEWWGEGGSPVAQELAQGRADTCLYVKWVDAEGHGQIGCPFNAKRTLWSLLTAPVAATVKRLLQLKSNMKMSVNGEKRLGTCKICLCSLPLKVHAPIKFIAEETDQEMLKEAPAFCWVRKEIENKS